MATSSQRELICGLLFWKCWAVLGGVKGASGGPGWSGASFTLWILLCFIEIRKEKFHMFIIQSTNYF